jgi:hypothetical protein
VSLFVSSSINNLLSSYTLIDIGIIIAYIVIFILFLIIGLYGLFNYKKARFNGKKTEIALEKPFKTIFLNYGMICFIAFFIFEMTYQALGL